MTETELLKFIRTLPEDLRSFANGLKDKPNEEIFMAYRPVPFRFIFNKHAYYEGKKEGYISGYESSANYISDYIDQQEEEND